MYTAENKELREKECLQVNFCHQVHSGFTQDSLIKW